MLRGVCGGWFWEKWVGVVGGLACGGVVWAGAGVVAVAGGGVAVGCKIMEGVLE